FYLHTVLVFFLIHLHSSYFYFFNDPPTTALYTLSLHDALPIFRALYRQHRADAATARRTARAEARFSRDRVQLRRHQSQIGALHPGAAGVLHAPWTVLALRHRPPRPDDRGPGRG